MKLNVIIIILSLLIVYTMIGYPLFLEILNKVVKHRKVDYSKTYEPSVTVIIAAYNEKEVIERKIMNLLDCDLSEKKFEIIIASDNSTDGTNEIVERCRKKYPDKVKLHKVKQRKGKTNAQDEAVKMSKGEILVFTDANSILKRDAIKELVCTLNDTSIGYVSGKLVYSNSDVTLTSDSENKYWNIDLRMREIESNLSSITAGNGSLYAVRKQQYMSIDPIYSHDSVFPPKFVLKGLRSVFNSNAIAYEKAGENDGDEFGRKVRMSRKIISINFLDIAKYNFFKYGWFSFFYVSHRTLRNNLYFMHVLLYISSFVACLLELSSFSVFLFIFQTIIFVVGIFGRKSINKYIRYIVYYLMTIFAQLIGAKNEITGKSKPFWEKAETTR